MYPADPKAYMDAGFTVQCGCRLDAAQDYVYHILFPDAFGLIKEDRRVMYKEEESRFYVNIGDDEVIMWAPSNYYWEDGLLLSRES